MRRCERLPAPPGCHQEGTWLERTGCGLGQEVLNPFEYFQHPSRGISQRSKPALSKVRAIVSGYSCKAFSGGARWPLWHQ